MGSQVLIDRSSWKACHEDNRQRVNSARGQQPSGLGQLTSRDWPVLSAVIEDTAPYSTSKPEASRDPQPGKAGLQLRVWSLSPQWFLFHPVPSLLEPQGLQAHLFIHSILTEPLCPRPG